VADEVRKLAERTSKSTEQISTMIDKVQAGTQRAVQEMEAGVTRVNEGVQLANRAGDSIASIQTGEDLVLHAVEDIAQALNEQTSAARQIALDIEQVAQMSEEHSAVARQVVDSAGRLQNLALSLKATVGAFKLG
jgi:methyl-accepting chemotaxis protein